MNFKKLIVMILTVCMIVTYMPVTGYVYADETDTDRITETTPAESETAEDPSNAITEETSDAPGTVSGDISDTPDTDKKAEIRTLAGETQREAFDEYVSSGEADNDIILNESGNYHNTYDLGEGTGAQVFFSYPVRYEDENGELVKIEPELVEVTEGRKGTDAKGYQYENKQGPYKTYIPDTLSEDTPILLENDKYSFTMAPVDIGIADTHAYVKDDKAVYGSEEDDIRLEYISQNDGLKENIILNERPETNEYTFALTFKNMYYTMDQESGGITFFDKETDEMVMGIGSPFMNDATEKAFSEDLEYEMTDPEDGEDTYTLKLKVSEKYLDDPERVYPITIDPTATWTGFSEVKDSYVQSAHPDTNFFSSSATMMKSGSGTNGVNRTYIHILNLKAELIGANITSAAFDIYETGNGRSGYSVRLHRIMGSWTNSSITWNNRPDIVTSSYIDTKSTNGNANHKMTYDVTSWVRKVANEDIHNYGLCLRNYSETGTTFTEFFGSRTGTTAYRPKLTVIYTEDRPSQATKITVTSPCAKGSKAYVSWEGITANKLDRVQYRISRLDAEGNVTDADYVPYTSIGSSASSGRHSIPNSENFPKGYYRIYLRGLSKQGITGPYQSKRFRIEDKPAKPSGITVSPSSFYTGDDFTVSWTGLTGSFLKRAEYRVAKLNSSGGVSNANYIAYRTLKTDPAASGSAVIKGTIKEPGTYRIYVRGANESGIVGEERASETVTVTKDNAPVISTVTLSKGNTAIDPEAYIRSGDINASVTGITDDRSLGSSSGSYRLLKDGKTVKSGSDIMLTQNGTSYSASFTVPQSAFTASGRYTLEFSVKDIGANTGKKTVNILIDDQTPLADIEVMELPQEGMLSIPFYATDKDSGIDEIGLELYEGTENDPGDYVMDLASNITDEKTVTFDAGTLANGPYTLKLTASDNAGNTTVLFRDFEVYNRVAKPGIGLIIEDPGTALRVDWEYDTAPDDLDHLEYSLNGGDWTEVSVSDPLRGHFTVPLAGLTGTISIRVRGVDSEDVPGDAARRDVMIDTDPPAVSISHFGRGILKGTVTDSNLKVWELFIKETQASDSTYVKIKEGTDTVNNGRICFVDPAEQECTNGTSYTLKLKATDTADNTSEDTVQFTCDTNEDAASFKKADDRVKRSLGQSYSEDSFTMLINEDDEVTFDISGETELTGISWYLNNSLIGTGRTLVHELSGNELLDPNKIAFLAEDTEGSKVFSRDLYIDCEEESVSFATPVSGVIEQEVELSEEAAAIRLDLPEESGVTYSVKAGSGNYETITPGELIYISDLDSNILKSDTFTLKTEGSQSTLENLNSFTVLLTAFADETFTVTSSQMEEYWPTSFSAEDRINCKTYLYWDVPSDLPSDISYEVHRSTAEDFEPGDGTLVAENIREGYWCDINVNYETEIFYRVRAVRKDNEGEITGSSSFTDCRMSSAISENEYLKHLGHKEYWGYAEVRTPNGTGYIEKHDGNFFYSTSDADVPNESLPFSFTRSYNSDSTSRSSLGYGWTNSYDLELLKAGTDDDIESGTLALRDGQGTIYTFSKIQDTYVSGMGRYMTLKEENSVHEYSVPSGNGTEQVEITSGYTLFSRDGIRYYFDANGKLLLMEEANGNVLMFSYDHERGMLDRITTGRGISVDFIYHDGDNGTDPLTLKEIRLPDGSKLVYGYTNRSRLDSVRMYPSDSSGQDDCITYTYSYSNKKMTGLTDGSGNSYGISYGTSPKTVTFTYPSVQSEPQESMRVTTGGTTVTEKLIGDDPVTREEDTFDSFGRISVHKTYIGNEYVSETYSYVNDLIAQETSGRVYDILELSDDGSSGTITKGVKEVTVSHEYDGNDNSTRDSYDTINDNTSETEYSYASGETTEWNEFLPTGTTESIGETVVSHEESEYDGAGNLTEYRDYMNHELVEYGYADGTGNEPKGTLISEEHFIMDDEGDPDGLKSSETRTIAFSGNTKTETVTNDSGSDRTVESTTYDQMGRMTRRTTYTYSSFGEPDQEITKEDCAYTYDGYGRETSETTVTSKADSGLDDIPGTVVTSSSEKTYYPNGALASETDERGITTSYSYDALNRLISTTVSKGGLTQTTETSYGYGLVTIHDGKGGTISYTNCLITTEYDNGTEIHKTYQDGNGRTVREINDGVITDYCYDLSGNRIMEFLVTEKAQDIQDEEGIATYTLHNEEGAVFGTVKDPVWEDGAFSVTEDSAVEVSNFDDRGNVSGARDPLGNVTGFGYDDENRITSVTLPDTDNVTYFEYTETSDSTGDYVSTVTMTDAMGGISTEVSDANGNTISITDSGKENENITPIETQFEYDGKGNVVKETKSSGDHISYSYDSEGRLTERREYTDTGSELTRTAYTYSGTTEDILTMSDYRMENGSPVLYHYEEYSYDDLGRMITKAEIAGNAVPSDITPYTITYSYDVHDNITGISYGSAIPTEISSVNYTYSGQRLTAVNAVINNSEYLLKEYTYTDWGAVDTVKDYYDFRTSGTSKYIELSYDYDRLTNLSEMVYTKEDDAVIETHRYSYDKAGRIITEENSSSLNELNEIRRFEYDSLGRLVRSDIKDITEESGITTEENKLITEYSYDKVGNRLSKTENGEGTAYVYNGLNQLLTETNGSDTLTYSYDSNGNQTGVTGTSDGETVSKLMTYTPGGMMETYSDGERVQQNTYTGGETRIRKAEGTSLQNLTDVTNYYYQEGSVLYTTDGDNDVRSFNLLNISDIFATEREGANSEEYYFYLDDIRGSKTDLIDAGAGQVASYWYTDFGEVSEVRSEDYENFANEVQYTGAIYDGSTGLLYLNARFYDPATGRFISQDSYRGERSEPDTWHLYAYCANDPINSKDPTGHFVYKHNKKKRKITITVYFDDADFVNLLRDVEHGVLTIKAVKKAAKKMYKKAIKKSIRSKIATALSKTIPVITFAWIGLEVAMYAASLAGYKGIKYTIKYKKVKVKKHQAGRTITGYSVKIKKSKVKLI